MVCKIQRKLITLCTQHVQNISVKTIVHRIEPFRAEDIVYHADTCIPLVDAVKRGKLGFKALARYTYPGDRLSDDTLGLNSIGYWNATEPQDWGLDWHRNEGIEIHFLESGSMPYAQETIKTNLLPNHLTITRPWEAHKVGNPQIGMGKFYWVIIDLGVRRPHQEWVWPDWIMMTKTDLKRLTKILRQDDQWLWQSNSRIRECFHKIGMAVDHDAVGSSASKIRLLVNELLILMLELIDSKEVVFNQALTDSSRSVKLFLNELDKNLSENWTIEQMADSAGVGLTRFTYHCKQLTNTTPMRYLTMKRIEQSKLLLLKDPQLSVAEVAYSCGFATSQYFSTVFKKQEKCTPLEYKTSLSSSY